MHPYIRFAGTGKSYMALDFIQKLLESNLKCRILIVCTRNAFAVFMARWIALRVLCGENGVNRTWESIMDCVRTIDGGEPTKARICKTATGKCVSLKSLEREMLTREESYDLVVIDEAHHIIRKSIFFKIYRRYCWDAKLRIVLSDTSQDPSHNATVKKKLERLREDENEERQSGSKIYSMHLQDIVRSTECITLASEPYRFSSWKVPACKSDLGFGKP